MCLLLKMFNSANEDFLKRCTNNELSTLSTNASLFYRLKPVVISSLFFSILAPSVWAADDIMNYDSSARIYQYNQEVLFNDPTSQKSIIKQQGYNNKANLVQKRLTEYQLGNSSIIYQKGKDNLAMVNQDGNDNFGFIWQLGQNHSAILKQTGVGTSVGIIQSGFNSDITVLLSDSGLRNINVEQKNHTVNSKPVIIQTN